MEILIEKCFTVKLLLEPRFCSLFRTIIHCRIGWFNIIKLMGRNGTVSIKRQSRGSPAAKQSKNIDAFLRKLLSRENFCRWFQSEKILLRKYQRAERIWRENKTVLFSVRSWLAALLKDLFFRLIKFLMKMNGISSCFFGDKDYYSIKSSEKIVGNSLEFGCFRRA